MVLCDPNRYSAADINMSDRCYFKEAIYLINELGYFLERLSLSLFRKSMTKYSSYIELSEIEYKRTFWRKKR